MTFQSDSAIAAPTNCTASTDWEHHYIGGQNSGTVWGASANIETQTMEICPSSGYSLWVSPVSFSGSTLNGWVQIGYRKKASYSTNQIYTEADDESSNYYEINEWGAPASGGNTYRVGFNYTGNWSTSYWQYIYNSDFKWSVDYDSVNFTPSTVQVYNELHDSGDQTAGTQLNPVSWSNILTKSTTTGSYTSVNVTKNIDSSVSGHTGTNMASTDNAWEIWDTRY